MRRVLIWAAAFLAVSCGTQRKAMDTETRDSTRVVVRTERIETIDTVYVELPRQSEKVAVKDSSSHLENDVAVSDASVDSLGFLHHSLEIKRARVKVPRKTLVEKKDSISVSSTSKSEVEKVFVEKPLTAWQRFRLRGFWVISAMAGGYAVWRNRKWLLHLLAKLIS